MVDTVWKNGSPPPPCMSMYCATCKVWKNYLKQESYTKHINLQQLKCLDVFLATLLPNAYLLDNQASLIPTHAHTLCKGNVNILTGNNV